MNIPNLEHDAFFPKGTASKVSDSFPKGLENFCFDKAIPNKLVDSHPIFLKNWGGWVFFIFYSHPVTGRLEIDKHICHSRIKEP